MAGLRFFAPRLEHFSAGQKPELKRDRNTAAASGAHGIVLRGGDPRGFGLAAIG